MEDRLKALVKTGLARVRLRRPAGVIYRSLQRRFRSAARAVRGVDRRIVNRYFAEAREPKLHIGCGDHLLAAWLNSDKTPRSADVMYLDAARPLPFPDATFVYVYGEHMIGDLSFRQAGVMLRECFRTLAPGGKIRIVTPDLAFLIGLYEERQPSDIQRRYMEWFSAQTKSPRSGGGFLVNYYAKAWGLEFVYDEPILREAMQTAGFSRIVRRGLNESDDAALRNLENEERLPDGFLRMESLILEGTKIA